MTDVTQGNQEQLRTPEGTIKDQTTTSSTTETTSPETKAAPDQSKTEPQSKPGEEKPKTALNAEEKKVEGAPEKYADFKLPEGVSLEGEALTAATTLFKDLGLSQDAAQKLVDFHVKQVTEAEDSSLKVWKEQQDAWKKQISEDPEIGPKMAEIKTSFSKMLDSTVDAKLATEFRQAMDHTGAGNNPAFIKVMHKISALFTEGKPVQGLKPAGQTDPGKATGTGPKALYPNLS